MKCELIEGVLEVVEVKETEGALRIKQEESGCFGTCIHWQGHQLIELAQIGDEVAIFVLPPVDIQGLLESES